MNQKTDKINFFVIDMLIYTLTISACLCVVCFTIMALKMLFGLAFA